jgi:hypothetical protein
MGRERAAKKLPELQTGGGGKGRPRLRWMDDVELGWRYMDVKNGEQEFWTE